MQPHVRKTGHRPVRAEARHRPALRTLVLLLPRFRNPDSDGSRRKIELQKWKTTLYEIRQTFSGYQVSRVRGWNREDRVRDELYRFEIDLFVTPARVHLIRNWGNVLARRFEQRMIYIKISDAGNWL